MGTMGSQGSNVSSDLKLKDSDHDQTADAQTDFRGGSRISGKGVHMYKVVGGSLC